MSSSIVHDSSTLPVITGTLQLQPHSRWLTLRFWSLVFIGLFLFSSDGFWRSGSSSSVDTAPVHPDQTVVKDLVHQVPQTVTLIYQNQQGDLVKVPVHAERYSQWVRQQMKTLEVSRQQLRQKVQADFTQGLDDLFQPVKEHIPHFADWYFSYGTSYQLGLESITSAISHLCADNLKETVTADIEKLIQTQYQYLVLKPELTDPLIQQLYQHTLAQAHHTYLRTLAAMEEDFQVFVSEHTTYLSDSLAVPELHLDWVAQVHKPRVAPDASTLSAVRGMTLTTLGAMAGKGIGLQVGTLLASRLALPFAERAVTAVGSSVVSAGTASIAGPIGATAGLLVGATVGIALDLAVHFSVELLERAAFEMTVQEAITSTQVQWQTKLLTALLHAVDVQFEDNLELLLQF